MAKKLKGEPKDKEEVEKENQLENLIATQTKQLFKVRDTIENLITKADLQQILFANGSGMVEGSDGLLDRCADFLTFGAIKKCSKCNKGDLIFSKFGYKCNGNLDEWTACDNFQEKPTRVLCKIPSKLKGKGNSFFSKYKSKIEDRAVRPNTLQNVKKDKSDEKRVAKVSREREPLYKMEVVVLNIDKPKEDLKAKITKLGGKLTTKIHEGTAVVISTPNEVEKMGKRMEMVELHAIQVVPYSFLDAVKKCTYNEAIEKIKSMAICDWGKDPLTRIAAEEKEKIRVNNS
jgi:poly [ADP-ribose] polymerase 1